MLSFIIPAYNEQDLIGHTLSAVHEAARTVGEAYEIIVVDDASADRTAAIAAAQGARVVTVHHRQIAATLPNFFRRSSGPGWALVGDAGYHKDPGTAQGITDAFRDAEGLATAIDAGLAGHRPLGDALAAYEQQRNTAVQAMYAFTCQLAALEPPSPATLQLYTALRGNQAAINRFFGTIAGTVAIEEFFAPEHLQHLFEGSKRVGSPSKIAVSLDCAARQ